MKSTGWPQKVSQTTSVTHIIYLFICSKMTIKTNKQVQ